MRLFALLAAIVLAPAAVPGAGQDAPKPAASTTPTTPTTPPVPAAAPAASGEYRAELSSGGASGGAKLTYRVMPTQLTVAQRVQVRLTVEAPAGWSVSWPAVGEKLGRATVVDTADTRDGLKQTRTITLEPYLPGDDSIPPLSVSVSPRDPQAGAEPVTLTTISVPLTIRALLAESDPGSLLEPELREVRTLDGTKAGAMPAWAVGVGAGCGTVLLVVVIVMTLRGGRVPADLAGEALAKLDALAGESAPQGRAARDAALDQVGASARDFLQARGVKGAVGAATPELAARLPVLPGTPRIVELLGEVDSARFDPREQAQAPGPLAAQLAAILRTTFAPAAQEGSA